MDLLYLEDERVHKEHDIFKDYSEFVGVDTKIEEEDYYFYDCRMLSTLPIWSNVTRVNCSYCNFSSFPCWPNATDIRIVGCKNLTNIPKWPKVEYLKCSDCPVLSKMFYMPKIGYISCMWSKIFDKITTRGDPINYHSDTLRIMIISKFLQSTRTRAYGQ